MNYEPCKYLYKYLQIYIHTGQQPHLSFFSRKPSHLPFSTVKQKHVFVSSINIFASKGNSSSHTPIPWKAFQRARVQYEVFPQLQEESSSPWEWGQGRATPLHSPQAVSQALASAGAVALVQLKMQLLTDSNWQMNSHIPMVKYKSLCCQNFIMNTKTTPNPQNTTDSLLSSFCPSSKKRTH